MVHNTEIRNFVQDNGTLFWWVKSEDKSNLSLEAIVEAVLNYGDKRTIKKLFDLVGIRQVADIFYRQTSGRRSNYNRRTQHFFEIYFKRHAH